MSAETTTHTDVWKSPRQIEEEARNVRHHLFEQLWSSVDDEAMAFSEAQDLFNEAVTDQQFAEDLLAHLIAFSRVPELTSR